MKKLNIIKMLASVTAMLAVLALLLAGCDEVELPRGELSADTTEGYKAPAAKVDIVELREKIEQVFQPQKDDFALDAVLVARYDGPGGAEYSIKCIDGMPDPSRESEWRAYATCVVSEEVFGQFFGLFLSDTAGISALGFTDDEMLTEQWLVELNGKEASAAVGEVLSIVLEELENNASVSFVDNQAASH